MRTPTTSSTAGRRRSPAATARRTALYVAAAAILLGSVIAGASRAGSALAVGEVLAVAVALAARQANRRRAVALWTAQFACFAAIAIAVVGWQGLRDRLGAPGTEVLRMDAVRASLAMIHDRPWMGSGLGTWTRMYPRYAGLDTGVTVNQAHNDWAQWAAEGGLPFLLVMILFAGLPNVAFQFEGREGAEGGVLPCSGPGGLQGEAALRLPANGNRLGEELLLISGAATLVRKLE